MTTEKFNRIANIEITDPEGVKKIFDGLRISFDIEKNSGSEANTSKIKVFNLTPNSRAFSEKEGLKIVLSVGYSGLSREVELVRRIFTGDVKKVKNMKNGPNFETIFECGDGETTITDSKINKSFATGTTVRTAIDALAATLKVVRSEITGVSTKRFLGPLTISGSVKEQLDVLTRSDGLEWSIQDDELIISRPDELKPDQAFLVSRLTGLLDIPIRTEKGIEFKFLIDPRIRPTTTVKIESQDVNDFFRVKACKFKGDTRGQDWFVTVEADK